MKQQLQAARRTNELNSSRAWEKKPKYDAVAAPNTFDAPLAHLASRAISAHLELNSQASSTNGCARLSPESSLEHSLLSNENAERRPFAASAYESQTHTCHLAPAPASGAAMRRDIELPVRSATLSSSSGALTFDPSSSSNSSPPPADMFDLKPAPPFLHRQWSDQPVPLPLSLPLPISLPMTATTAPLFEQAMQSFLGLNSLQFQQMAAAALFNCHYQSAGLFGCPFGAQQLQQQRQQQQQPQPQQPQQEPSLGALFPGQYVHPQDMQLGTSHSTSLLLPSAAASTNEFVAPSIIAPPALHPASEWTHYSPVGMSIRTCASASAISQSPASEASLQYTASSPRRSLSNASLSGQPEYGLYRQASDANMYTHSSTPALSERGVGGGGGSDGRETAPPVGVPPTNVPLLLQKLLLGPDMPSQWPPEQLRFVEKELVNSYRQLDPVNHKVTHCLWPLGHVLCMARKPLCHASSRSRTAATHYRFILESLVQTTFRDNCTYPYPQLSLNCGYGYELKIYT